METVKSLRETDHWTHSDSKGRTERMCNKYVRNPHGWGVKMGGGGGIGNTKINRTEPTKTKQNCKVGNLRTVTDREMLII